MKVAAVLIPLPVDEPFDYVVPDDMTLARGDLVTVPLGPRQMTGVVSEVREIPTTNRRLKAIVARLDLPALPAATLDFLEWAARWTLSPPGEMAVLSLKALRHAPPKPPFQLHRVAGKAPVRLTPARAAVLQALDEGPTVASAAELGRAAGVSAGVVKGLVDEGVITARPAETGNPLQVPDPHHARVELNPDQAEAAGQIGQAALSGDFVAFLLDGVTGSGKTEAYLEAVARLLEGDSQAQALILLPEIALTQAVIARITARFGAAPAEWHSGLTGPRRRQVWDAVVSGHCRIVVGARSALFLPFPNLRLIVVDEEHDGSYKQEDGLIYQGRDLAVARARFESAAVLPDITLLDLRADPPEPQTWLSPPLRAAMAETLARGEQTLLFLNRRGYAPVVLCRACGHRMTAPDTDSWLVEHRYTGRLVCHLTGFSMARPDTCPSCGAKDSLVPVGPGVERVEEEVRSLFPEARTTIFSSDTTPDGRSARDLVEAMERGEIDILVATQAAAKGHNFPNLTLVGVVDADLGLRGGDLRAAERTFQLLMQATGRAGRAERPGRALLQTWTPEHPVLQALAAGDRDIFLATESEERRLAALPPFGRLAALILSGDKADAVEKAAQLLAGAIPNAERLEVYGPADAPLALVRGRRRKRLLVRADRDVDIQAFLRAWLARVKLPSSVRLSIDVDPYSFL